MTTGRRFRVWDRHVDTSGGAAASSSVRITVATPMGSIVIVTEDAAELIGDVGSAVATGRVID